MLREKPEPARIVLFKNAHHSNEPVLLAPSGSQHLGRSQCGSASQLRGEREALISMLRSEIIDMEEVGSQAHLQPLATSTTKN